MIDTIKFKIRVEKNVWNRAYELKENSLVVGTGVESYIRYWHTPIKLGSYDRNINIFGYKESPNYIYIECNPCKLINGTNMYPTTLDAIKAVLEYVQGVCVDNLGDIPDLKLWMVTRLDLCATWLIGSEEKALYQLSVMKNLVTSNKRIEYDTSFYCGALKWYMKYPEYMSKTGDFKYLKKYDDNLAYELKKHAEGMLRAEVKLNLPAIKRNFKNISILTILDNEDLIRSIFERYLKMFYKGLKHKETAFELFLRLNNKYGTEIALKLLGFQNVYYNRNLRKQIKMDKSTIFRYKQKIRILQGGLIDDVKILSLNSKELVPPKEGLVEGVL